MEFDSDNSSNMDRSLRDLLEQFGIDINTQEFENNLSASVLQEIKDLFMRIKHEGFQKIRDVLLQRGLLLQGNDGNLRFGLHRDFTDISIVGRITAGHLLPAVQADFGYVRFEGTLSNPHELYALEVVGDSMIGDDIENGDCVLIRRGELRDGQIGAVVVDDETTLKRVYRQPGGIRLVPSNPSYDSVYIPLDDIRSCNILGRLEAVISRYSGQVRWISNRQFDTKISLYLN